MKRLLVIIIALISICACKKDQSISREVAKIDVDLTVERFDRIFAEANPSDLPELKQAYPFLFSGKFPDSLWIAKMQDTLQQQLSSETNKVFSDFKSTGSDIKQLFQHLKFYFPEFKTPRVITVTSNVDYRNKVIVTDSIVLIALDTYLGSDHEFYKGIQQYLVQNFKTDQIIPDMAAEYAKKYSFQQERRTFLDEMIYFGKLLYFKDRVVPLNLDASKIGYTQSQLEWANENEAEIWRYFVEKELLFSTNQDLISRFINPAPFSKFYLELDSESPGRIGQYLG
ncbi:MAG: gliding motility lipoprotein GldB, partial [Flavobacteriaceae bacterium]|nr:gliding motility lipoprotein GldB [Flavobacteriaceae bacterium]